MFSGGWRESVGRALPSAALGQALWQKSKATDKSVRRTRRVLEHSGVVFFQVDLVSALVLRVALGFRSELGAVLLTVAVDLMVERSLFRFQMGGLARGQLSGFQFGSAMLLSARRRRSLCMSVGDYGAVTFVTDGLRDMCLLMLWLNSVGRRDPSAIVVAHVARFGAGA